MIYTRRPKKVRIAVTLHPDVHRIFEAIAQREDMTLSAFATRLIRENAKEREAELLRDRVVPMFGIRPSLVK